MKLTFKGLQPETVEAGLVRNPGIVSTANHCVSAIPYVVAAEPGIKTYLDLPADRRPRRAATWVGSAFAVGVTRKCCDNGRATAP